MNFLLILKKATCYYPSAEWFVYLIVIISLFSFFIVSCYNAYKLFKYGDEDTNIRDGLHIAMECVIIFVGIYFMTLKNKITKLQLCFCSHVGLFLLFTGITTMIATARALEK